MYKCTHTTIKNESSNEEVSALPGEHRDHIVEQWWDDHGANARPTNCNASGQRTFWLKVVTHTHNGWQVHQPKAYTWGTWNMAVVTQITHVSLDSSKHYYICCYNYLQLFSCIKDTGHCCGHKSMKHLGWSHQSLLIFIYLVVVFS